MRKRRTREHVIADLSVNHVERFVLRAGHVAERVQYDYGYDLFILTFNANGEVEPGYLLVQLKATDAPHAVADNSELALVIERRDIEAWLAEATPVFLVLYDAAGDSAYWLYVQEDLASLRQSSRSSQTVTVRLSRNRVLNESAVEEWRRIKQRVVLTERNGL